MPPILQTNIVSKSFFPTTTTYKILIPPLTSLTNKNNLSKMRKTFNMDPADIEKGFSPELIKYLREYNETTGIQGLRYLTEKRSTAEKIFWGITVIISLAGCVYMIREIVIKYETSPVVVSFATQDTPIYEIPLPAITICPESKYSSKLFNYAKFYFDLRNESFELKQPESQYYEYLNLLCDNPPWDRGNKTVGEDFIQTLVKLAPEIQMNCIINNNYYDCPTIFTPVLIDQGLCFSYNILDRSEVFTDQVTHYSNFHQVNFTSDNFNIETGYEDTAETETYPRRALVSGARNSFIMFLKYNSNDTDYVCNEVLQGYRMSIHNAWEVPRLSNNYLRIPIDKSVVAAVEPELVTTSTSVKVFPPKKRKCYLTHERPLKYFKIYTQSNCLFDCLTSYTLEKCGCVEYYMPRNNSISVCGPASYSCTAETEKEFQIKNLRNKVTGNTFCDCKPGCTSLKYKVDSSQTYFYWREYYNVQQHFGVTKDVAETSDEIHWSSVAIYLKSEQFLTLERNELYGTSDLISNFGGLLGLFTGFSLISVVEIVYFLALRIFCNLKIYNTWYGQQN